MKMIQLDPKPPMPDILGSNEVIRNRELIKGKIERGEGETITEKDFPFSNRLREQVKKDLWK